LGRLALRNNTTGSNNTALGYNTGQGITTGSGNTVLGANVTGLAAGLTNNIILANGTGAIKAQHDGTDWAFTGAATFSGDVGIGTTTPQGKLNVYSGAAGGGYNSDYDELVLSNSGRAGINILSSATDYSAIIMGGKVDNSTGGIYHNAANNMLSLATEDCLPPKH
jgi:hypothetical protein